MVCPSVLTDRTQQASTEPKRSLSMVPRLWPALPPERRRQLAQELARLLCLIRAPALAGLENSHADGDIHR
jgi:hypothetical protein